MAQATNRTSVDDEHQQMTDRVCRMLDSWVLAATQYQVQASQTRCVLVLGVTTLGIGTAAILAQAGSLGLASTFLLMMFSCALFLNHSYGGWSTAWERTCAKLVSVQSKIAEKGAGAVLDGRRRLVEPHALAERERKAYRICPLDAISRVLYLITVILLFCLFLFLVDQHYVITIDVQVDQRQAVM